MFSHGSRVQGKRPIEYHPLDSLEVRQITLDEVSEWERLMALHHYFGYRCFVTAVLPKIICEGRRQRKLPDTAASERIG